MSTQNFVYGRFERPTRASRAVTRLINQHVNPEEIDVLTVRGQTLKRVPLVHYRPVLPGLLIGLAVGGLAGLAFGLTFGQDITRVSEAWIPALRWAIGGGATGALAGAMGGLAWWRTKVDLSGEPERAEGFIVGTTVPEPRTDSVERVLSSCAPRDVDHFPIGPGEAALQHQERLTVARL